MVDLEKDWEGNEAVLTEAEDVVGAGLAEGYVLIVDVSVLIELGEACVEPEGKPCGFAQYEVGVLVVDGGERMLALCVEAEQDVVSIRGAHEEAGEVELAFGEIL